jgi:2,4-dienoyl-CoA reductase-like NADH-dependent reductase (Old Yellow Enzyme family)
MRFPPPGHFRTAATFRAHLRELGVDFDCDDSTVAHGALAQPIRVAGKTLDNRFCAHPMEGWDGTEGGSPTAHTQRRWRHFGRSGAALVWGGEAFAVQQDGRANKNQLCLHRDSERDLSLLLTELRAGRREISASDDGVLIGLQLTHSGRFARPLGPFAPKITQHHPLLAKKYALPATTPLLTDTELEAIGEQFVRAAVTAERAGFDFVDVKCCHGYLLHELLASKTRNGTYGGPALASRMRLFERIVAGIRTACPNLHIGVRLSAADVAPYGKDESTGRGTALTDQGIDLANHHFNFLPDATASTLDLDEATAFLQRCTELSIELCNVTLGSPYWNPHLQRPAAYPPSDGYLPPLDPLHCVATHLRVTRQLTQSVKGMAFVGTGYTYLQEWLPHVAQRAVANGEVTFVGIGRMLLSYPELPADVIAGRALQQKRLCRTFSDCTTAPRNGMVSGCFPLDPYYRALPEADHLKQRKRDQGT